MPTTEKSRPQSRPGPAGVPEKYFPIEFVAGLPERQPFENPTHVRPDSKLVRALVESIKKKARKISSAVLGAQEAVPNVQGRF